MASVHIYMIPSGKRNSFEATDTHLLLYDPISKKIISNKRGSSEISDKSKVEVSSFGNNAGIGKTGVHLQYHKTPEYATLYKYQKEEIHEWRLKKPNSKGRTKGRENKRPNRNKSIAAAANKQVEKTLSEAIKDAEAETSPQLPKWGPS